MWIKVNFHAIQIRHHFSHLKSSMRHCWGTLLYVVRVCLDSSASETCIECSIRVHKAFGGKVSLVQTITLSLLNSGFSIHFLYIFHRGPPLLSHQVLDSKWWTIYVWHLCDSCEFRHDSADLTPRWNTRHCNIKELLGLAWSNIRCVLCPWHYVLEIDQITPNYCPPSIRRSEFALINPTVLALLPMPRAP